MPSDQRARRCAECPSMFITRSPTQPLCPRCRAALKSTAASAQERISELEAIVSKTCDLSEEQTDKLLAMHERATAAEARADRLAKALEPFAAEHECDGHSTVEDFNMEVQISVRWAIIKAARAALQQETQP